MQSTIIFGQVNVNIGTHSDQNGNHVPTFSIEDLLVWRKSLGKNDTFVVRNRIFPNMSEFELHHFENPGKLVDIDILALLDLIDAYKYELARIAQNEYDAMINECKDFKFNESKTVVVCQECWKLGAGNNQFYLDCDRCRGLNETTNALARPRASPRVDIEAFDRQIEEEVDELVHD